MSQKEKPKRQTRIELLPCGGVGGNDMKETGMEVRFLGLPFYLVLTFEMWKYFTYSKITLSQSRWKTIPKIENLSKWTNVYIKIVI